MLRNTAAYGAGANDERTVSDGFRDGIEFFGVGEKSRSVHGGARFAKCEIVGVHHTQMEKAKIAHGARGGTDIERVARVDEHDSKPVELGQSRQGTLLYNRARRTDEGGGGLRVWRGLT